jgi:SAM-dependent methyltransferase
MGDEGTSPAMDTDHPARWPLGRLLGGPEHDAYGAIEDEFNESLDTSLRPRGPDLLYALVAELGRPAGAVAFDIGCGVGRYSIELARRFHFTVRAFDPAKREIEIARARLADAARKAPTLAGRVTFEPGTVEHLPAESASADLVWCRDVLSLVEELPAAYAEIRRVLKPGGHALVYQMFATELLEPAEAAWLLPTMGCFRDSMDPAHVESAITGAGLSIHRRIVLGTEWGEYDQEHAGKPGRKLLHAGRLLRDPDRYIARFGQANYDIALGDCLWHVYRLIGKLSGRVYLLSA